MAASIARVQAITITQKKRTLLLTRLTAAQLVRISYVAQRGVTKEKGAVQRLLNRARIQSIAEFAIEGGDFPNSVVLNWNNSKQPLVPQGSTLSIPLASKSAQLIDGQHRVEGLKEAIKRQPSLGKIEIPVAIYRNLTTNECADIFLSINTEQKPVSRSLVFDLYEVASDYIKETPVVEAKYIADSLNTLEQSPYFGMIRYPGPKTAVKGIALSSVVGVLKPLVVTNGAFDQVGLVRREDRVGALINYLSVLKDAYDSHWDDKDNPFRHAVGFWGAIEFFSNKILRYCHLHDSFGKATIKRSLKDLPDSLIWRSEIEGMQGRRAANTIAELLNGSFSGKGKQRKVNM